MPRPPPPRPPSADLGDYDDDENTYGTPAYDDDSEDSEDDGGFSNVADAGFEDSAMRHINSDNCDGTDGKVRGYPRHSRTPACRGDVRL